MDKLRPASILMLIQDISSARSLDVITGKVLQSNILTTERVEISIEASLVDQLNEGDTVKFSFLIPQSNFSAYNELSEKFFENSFRCERLLSDSSWELIFES